MSLKKTVIMGCLVVFSTVGFASDKKAITVEKVYSALLKTYDENGKPSKKLLAKAVMDAVVQNGGAANELGLIEVLLKDGNKAWIKPSHVKTTFIGKVCKAVEEVTAHADTLAPVSSGWEAECDEES